jgi:hypothetical protein
MSGCGRERHGSYACHQFGFALDEVDLVAKRAETVSRSGVNRCLGFLRHTEASKIRAGTGPQLPLAFGQYIAGVGKRGTAQEIGGASDVIGMRVSDDDSIDAFRPDPGDIEACADGTGCAGTLAAPVSIRTTWRPGSISRQA